MSTVKQSPTYPLKRLNHNLKKFWVFTPLAKRVWRHRNKDNLDLNLNLRDGMIGIKCTSRFPIAIYNIISLLSLSRLYLKGDKNKFDSCIFL